MLPDCARKPSGPGFGENVSASIARVRYLSPAHFPLIRDDGHCSGIAVLLVIGVPVLCRRYITVLRVW
jgi:hypothetical protein